MNKFISVFGAKIFIALAMVVVLLFCGVMGYRFISDYTWLDALYMTVITITTVGFQEVNPLDDASKVFTIFLIMASLVIVGYFISIVTEFILSKNNIEELIRKRMQKKIDHLKGHIIICGYGRNGKQAAKKLSAYKKPFVIIEKEYKHIERQITSELLFIEGDANDDDILKKAGVERASTLITALPSDADNLFVVLSARQISKSLHIISRASQETSYDKLKLAGANNVILPDVIGGDHMASLVVVPDLVEFIDKLSIVGKSKINIENIPVEVLYDPSTPKSIKDMDFRHETGCTVIGYKSPNGEYTINPDANVKLIPNSRVIVLGRPEQIDKLNILYNI